MAITPPVTTIGRIIAIFVMFSGIGIVVAVLGPISQRRLQRVESRFKSKPEVKSRLQGDETKAAIQNKIGEMEKLIEEDFEAHFVILYYFRGSVKMLSCALVPQEYLGHFSIPDSLT